MSILVVQKDAQGLQAAVMRDNRLYAYRSQNGGGGICEEQIYLGVVDRLQKGVNAAFVKLPGNDFGFLPFDKEKHPLRSGERVLVQVKRPPNNAKKAYLTMDVALAGQYLVLLPMGGGISVSKRVEQEEERSALRKLARRIKPEKGGIVMRSAALQNEADACEECVMLEKRWNEIEKKARMTSVPSLLWDGEDVVSSLLREETTRLEYILTNAPDALPEHLPCIVRTADEPFLLHNVEHKLERSQRRTVRMKSGATLVIDRCEAMTVIDVNSAMAGGGKNVEETAERINLEATGEVARLLRLLRIGGMILVDFIDMGSDDSRERVLNAMRCALQEDPVKTAVYGFTQLGLMEITRRRGETPLEALRDIPCPHCCGTGALTESEDDLTDA